MAYIVTNDALKSELIDANKTYAGDSYFRQLARNIEGQYGQEVGLAASQYRNSVLGSTFQNEMQQQAIGLSNLSELGKQTYTAVNQNDIEEAYASYRQNYLSQLQGAQSTYETNMAAVDKALTTQADYTRRVADSSYDYIKWLYEQNPEEFIKNPYYSQYTAIFESDLTDDMMRNYFESGIDMAIRDEEGNVINDLGSIQGMYTLDDEGNQVLSDYGKEIYRQMFGNQNIGTGLTYSDYLLRKNEKGEATDQDLFEWLAATNPYDFGRTNLGTIQNLFELTEGKQGFDILTDRQRRAITADTNFDTLYAEAKNEKDVGKLDDKTINLYRDALSSLESAYQSVGRNDEYEQIVQEFDDIVKNYNYLISGSETVSAQTLAHGSKKRSVVANSKYPVRVTKNVEKTKVDKSAELKAARKQIEELLTKAKDMSYNK